MSSTPKSTWMTLVHSLQPGNTTYFHMKKSCFCCEANSFSVNPLKCELAIQDSDLLGYWLTPLGLMPWHKNLSQMCGCLAVVNHYQWICSQNAPISCLCSSVSLANPPSDGQSKWTLHWNAWKPLWCSTASLSTHISTNFFTYILMLCTITWVPTLSKTTGSVSFWSLNLNDFQCKYTVGIRNLSPSSL